MTATQCAPAQLAAAIKQIFATWYFRDLEQLSQALNPELESFYIQLSRHRKGDENDDGRELESADAEEAGAHFAIDRVKPDLWRLTYTVPAQDWLDSLDPGEELYLSPVGFEDVETCDKNGKDLGGEVAEFGVR